MWAHTSSETLLAFLELLQKPEVTWDLGAHFDVVFLCVVALVPKVKMM